MSHSFLSARPSPASASGAGSMVAGPAVSSGFGAIAGLLRATLDRLAPALPVSLSRHFTSPPRVFRGVLTMLKVKERRLGSGAIGMGPRRRFGTVLALVAALFATALWAQPAQAVVPSKPMYVETQWLDASVRLRWDSHGYEIADSWKVRHASSALALETTDWTDIGGDWSTTGYTFRSLVNDTEYHFQVRAVNADGDGAVSDVVTGTPNAAAPRVTSIEHWAGIGSPTNHYALRWVVTFSEPVRNIDPTDFSISIGRRNEQPGVGVVPGTLSTQFGVYRIGPTVA